MSSYHVKPSSPCFLWEGDGDRLTAPGPASGLTSISFPLNRTAPYLREEGKCSSCCEIVASGDQDHDRGGNKEYRFLANMKNIDNVIHFYLSSKL